MTKAIASVKSQALELALALLKSNLIQLGVIRANEEQAP